jgi:hypothetical protein
MEISVIELTSEELELIRCIPFSPKREALSQEEYAIASTAAASLMRSLLKRKVIPKIRIRYFFDADFNTRSRKSHKEIFEMNGTSGEDIYKHPHFWPFLHYFIFGPDLPKEIKEAFLQIIGSEEYISGSDMAGLRKFVRSQTRKYGLYPKEVSEEFYKLALECGIENNLARMIRDAVQTIK